MKTKLFALLTIILFCLSSNTYSQLATGQWKSHLAYARGQRLAVSDHKVYCVASGNLFAYGLQDNAIEAYSKVNGLSDVYIEEIAYCKTLETLVICYDNGNIDLLNNEGITNIPDLKRKAIYGSKKVNGLNIIDKTAYLSTDLGALKINIEKAEISETYKLTNSEQNAVHGIAILDETIYAATDNGLFVADVNNINLQNFAAWEKCKNLTDLGLGIAGITTFANQIIIAQIQSNGYYIKAGSTQDNWRQINAIGTFYNFGHNEEQLLISSYSYIKIHNNSLGQIATLTSYQFENQAFPGQNSIKAIQAYPLSSTSYCIADDYSGLVIYDSNSTSKAPTPSGPGTNPVWDIDISENIVRTVPGGTTKDINNIWRVGVISTYRDNKWSFLSVYNGGQSYHEYLNVLADPLDKEHYFVSSYTRGVLEYQGNTLIKRHYDANSSIENASSKSPNYVRTYGMAFDQDHNLWVSNSSTTTQLHVKTDDDIWYPIKSDLTQESLKYSKVLVTNANQKWVVCPYFGDGILAYDDNGTLDDTSDDRDKYFSLYASNSSGTTELVSDNVETFALDNDGTMWVGCDHGVVLYSNPDRILDDSGDPIGYRINIPRNDGTGNGDYLLSEETVQDIAVDGGNRKWLATKSSGALLVSSDGLEVIHHFTSENSPLFSNNVKAIEINHETGEVFIGTEKGLISYQADASASEDDFSALRVYPNPVREDYFGDITITGLVEESTVKITDVSGNLVQQVESNGGTATWDGNNFYGERVGTGVYLMFCSDKSGERSGMTKVMLVN